MLGGGIQWEMLWIIVFSFKNLHSCLSMVLFNITGVKMKQQGHMSCVRLVPYLPNTRCKLGDRRKPWPLESSDNA